MKREPFLLLPCGMCPFCRPRLFHQALAQTQSLIFLSLMRWEYVDSSASCCHPSLFDWVFPQACSSNLGIFQLLDAWVWHLSQLSHGVVGVWGKLH